MFCKETAAESRALQSSFRKKVSNTFYLPCNSHKQNHVIAFASKLPLIRNFTTNVNKNFVFLSFFAKETRILGRVIGRYCNQKTRIAKMTILNEISIRN